MSYQNLSNIHLGVLLKTTNTILVLSLFFRLSATGVEPNVLNSPQDSIVSWLADNYEDNPDTYYETIMASLEKARESGDKQFLGDVHFYLMRWHAYHVPFINDSIFVHGEKAIEIFKEIGDRVSLAEASAELAIEYVEENDLNRSEQLIFSAIDIYEKLGDEKGLGATYRRLSSIFVSQQEPELAIKYGLEAIEYSTKNDDHYTTAVAYMTLILAYTDAGQLEKAVEAGDNCVQLASNTDLLEQPFLLARGYAYRGDTWADLGNYQKSLEDNIKSYDIIESEIGAARPAAKTYRHGIGRAYYMQKKYREALPHLVATVEGYQGLGQHTQPKMQVIYNDLADCYAQIGSFEKAYEFKQWAHTVLDTLMVNKVRNLEAEGLIKYETGKKEEALAMKDVQLAQQHRIQLLSYGGLGLLLALLGGLLYFYRKNRQFSSKLEILNGDLTKRNQENEILLKEIHHRVKNNLQVISSLLNFQSRSIEDKNAKSAILDSQSRVRSMSLIHQKLYRGTNLAAIEMKNYLDMLSESLIDSYSDEEVVDIHLDMVDLELDVDYAIPIGLIVNELLTNSLKYAFPDGQKGAVMIKLLQEEKELILDISDNGIGKVDGKYSHEGGFGSELVEMLTLQLKGEVNQNTEEGYHTQLRIPYSKVA